MITSTSMDPSHTEVVTISNVDNKVITFTPSLQHRHLGKLLVRAFLAWISTSIHQIEDFVIPSLSVDHA